MADLPQLFSPTMTFSPSTSSNVECRVAVRHKVCQFDLLQHGLSHSVKPWLSEEDCPTFLVEPQSGVNKTPDNSSSRQERTTG